MSVVVCTFLGSPLFFGSSFGAVVDAGFGTAFFSLSSCPNETVEIQIPRRIRPKTTTNIWCLDKFFMALGW